MSSSYNIYKIHKFKEKEFKDILKARGLSIISTKNMDGYGLSFYFSKKPPSKKPGWIETYSEFFDLSDEINKEDIEVTKNYYAVLLIENNDVLYAVSIGRSHFYLKKFCIIEFGVELGTRIIDTKSVDTKRASHHGGRKKSSLTSYQANTELDVESGESIEFLKGKTIDKDIWGAKLICGHSARFSIKGLKPGELTNLILKIESKLNEDPLFDIPRSSEIQDDDLKKSLDQKLIEHIENQDIMINMTDSSLSGVDLIFIKDYSLTYKGNEINPDEGIIDLYNLIIENGPEFSQENLDRIKIRASLEDGNGYTENIRHFLDFIDLDNHFLKDGKWHKFNKTYLDILRSSINSIDFSIEEKYNFNYDEFTSYKASLPESERNSCYAEKYYNETIAQKFDFINLDRKLNTLWNHKIEITDLFKDDTLHFVKIGKPNKLHYAVDQSLASLSYLQANDMMLELRGKMRKTKALCLWFVLDRSEIIELNDFRSFILKMKLDEWRKKIYDARLEPKVLVCYKN